VIACATAQVLLDSIHACVGAALFHRLLISAVAFAFGRIDVVGPMYVAD